MQITAKVNYHVKKNGPQAFEFDVDGIFGTLVSPELITTDVNLSDIGNSKTQPKFLKDGIARITAPSNVQEFGDFPRWQAVYDAELSALLKTEAGAAEVIIFRAQRSRPSV